MAESYNGVTLVPRKSTESSEEAVGPSTAADDVPKILPLEIELRGFYPVPYVRLEREDITPYLNGHRKPDFIRQFLKKRGKTDVHARRLSQKCFVQIRRDDLKKLKNTFQRSQSPSLATSSDSECGDSSEMAVNCKICNKSYNSEKKLLKHQQNKHIIYKTPNKMPKRVSFSDHVIIHEVKEYHKCRKCPKLFEDYKSLKQHMRQWHKKRNCYICNYCNKKFVDRMFFKVHIRLHCDVCKKLFPTRSTYLQHRRDSCRTFQLHKCNHCDDSFFKIMDLKDHSHDHADPCFICDFCKEQFQSKCAVAHHLAFLHSTKKRPEELYVMRKMGTERLYLCKFCDESSVERDAIERHGQRLPDLSNRATIGYKDYYFCDQCKEQFDTETDMLQHKWSHFLKTSDNSQLRPKSILTKRKEKTYNINNIPEYFKPYVVLERLDDLWLTQDVEIEAVNELSNTVMTKAVVDPKSKKTILSSHQCETCGKYFSNNYGLNRHISTQHEDFENLRCKVCEETFVWPSLLKSHKCIRLNLPEMPFDDARAEILFDNYSRNGFDDLINIEESEDYANVVDFDIPAPVVELRECDSTFQLPVLPNGFIVPDKNGVSPNYRLVMQEVPIEF